MEGRLEIINRKSLEKKDYGKNTSKKDNLIFFSINPPSCFFGGYLNVF